MKEAFLVMGFVGGAMVARVPSAFPAHSPQSRRCRVAGLGSAGFAATGPGIPRHLGGGRFPHTGGDSVLGEGGGHVVRTATPARSFSCGHHVRGLCLVAGPVPLALLRPAAPVVPGELPWRLQHHGVRGGVEQKPRLRSVPRPEERRARAHGEPTGSQSGQGVVLGLGRHRGDLRRRAALASSQGHHSADRTWIPNSGMGKGKSGSATAADGSTGSSSRHQERQQKAAGGSRKHGKPQEAATSSHEQQQAATSSSLQEIKIKIVKM